MKRLLLAALFLSALPLCAQDAAPGRVATLAAEWERAKLGATEYLDAMPDDHIHFKPTPEIRSFAEQYLHIANANYMFAARVSGRPNPNQGVNLEQSEEAKKSKAALRQAVLASYDFAIEAVKGMSAAQLQENVEIFRTPMTRDVALTKAIEHHAHHRGQTTIYLRLQGQTPPSERLF